MTKHIIQEPLIGAMDMGHHPQDLTGKFIGMMVELREDHLVHLYLIATSVSLASFLVDLDHVDKEVIAMGSSIEPFLQQILRIGYAQGIHAPMQLMEFIPQEKLNILL